MENSGRTQSNITKSLTHLTAAVAVVLVSMSLLLTGCFDISEGGYSPVWSPDGSKIVYILYKYERVNKSNIWVMDSNGANKRNLTNNPAPGFSGQPAWSPDGNRIAFAAEGGGNSDIWAIDIDGNNRLNLTDSPASDFFPAWSPDGKKIAFVSFQSPSSPPEIMVMGADGGNARRLSGPNPNRLGASPPVIWSPDGSKILFVYSVFEKNTENAFGLWVMNTDVTNMTMLLNNAQFPEWSPDGSKIACMVVTNSKSDVWIVNSDGSSPTQLTTNGAAAYPSWSPDGSKIFFSVMSQGALGQIWVMNQDGSDSHSLKNPNKVAVPVRSPDRSRIAFVSTARAASLFNPGHVNIWVMNIDGTGLEELTD